MNKPATESSVHYEVAVHPERHEIEVGMRLTGELARGRIRLAIPTWVPGDYTFAQLARDLFEVQAFDQASGAALPVSRDGWQGFLVEGGSGDVLVRYRAWAYSPELSEQSGIVDSQYAVLLGTRLLHSPDYLGPCSVHYDLPAAWRGRIHHPSGATPCADDSWLYPSYEVLLDTPVVMGEFAVKQRVVCGAPINFVFVDGGVGFDAGVDRFTEQVAAVAADFHQIFGGFPFSDYTFVLSLNPQNSWGLEHLTSTMCGLDQDVFVDPDKHAIGVRVCAHELFHAWNVRRLRPAPFKHLASDLDKGSFSDGLWMAEGFTRYYEFLSCTRAGVYGPEQFFSNIVGYFEHLCAVPAYRRVSAADSSLTTYLSHSPKYAGRPANCIDYYDKGMLIAFGADATLRLGSATQSLDSAFCGFYERFANGGPDFAGYTAADTFAYFENERAGLGKLIEAAVLHPGGLNTEALLDQLGWRVEREPIYQLGLMFLNDGAPALYNVLDDTPAGQCGLAPDDQILAVNGYSYTPAALAWAASRPDPVRLEVQRGHRRLHFTMLPASKSKIARLVWDGDDAQAARLQAWLGGSFKLARGQVFSVSFYENFHGIETVL